MQSGMISGRVRPPRDGLPGGNARLSWTYIMLYIMDIITWGIEGCPSVDDVRMGCGVVGRFPRGGERGAAARPAPVFRLVRQPPIAPYECETRPLRAWLRHLGYNVRMRLLITL